MAKKILLTALVGSVIVFAVSSIIHIGLGLGEIGLKMLPHEDVLLLAMRASIRDSGFYIYPGTASGMSPNKATPAEREDYLTKFQRGPTGILIYQTGPNVLNFPQLLIAQYLFGLAGSLIVAWILVTTAGSTTFAARVGIVALVGLFAGITYDLPYWNWYGFPTNYIVAHIVTATITWAIAGTAMAAMVKKPAAS
jgi:hypothetical protein